MNTRENALRIIRFDQPERVMSAPPFYKLHYYGANHEGFNEGLLGDENPAGSWWRDIWGTGWHKIHEGTMGLPEENPLARPESLATFRGPDPNDERICGLIYREMQAFPGGDLLLTGVHRDTLWEQAYMSVGMQALMICFYTDPDFVRELLHRIMDFQLGIARHYVDLGTEVAMLGDDLGTQHGPLLSPRIMNGFLKPEYERIFRFYREHDVLIWFHSCGDVSAALPMLLELGVDILNPVQATANDLERLRAATQGRMALHGGVNSATVMDGPVERIAAEARLRMWQLGQAGGYFCSPDQGLPWPQEHLDVLHRAVEEHGWYPLQPPGGNGVRVACYAVRGASSQEA
jgi:uroporphyrinogen decarboxylase